MSHFVFYLVHGTQFYLFRKPVIDWVEDDEERMRQGLREALQQHTVEFVEVHWSGRNRQRARLQAANILTKCIEERPAAESHEFVIAHSHGGNAAVFALKGSAADRIAGVGCLSTPFLFFSGRQERLLKVAIFWIAAVLLAASLAAAWLSGGEGASSMLVVAVTLLATIIFLAVLLWWALRRGNTVDSFELPRDITTPLFIAHTPGDEATGALGAVSLAASMSARLEGLLERGLQFFSRYPNILVAAVVFAPLFVLVGLLGGLPLLLWGLGVPVAVFALLSLPLRLTVLGLAYGLDLIPVGVLHAIAAAPTPLGPNKAGQFRMMTVDWLPDDAVAHSQTYRHPEVIAALAGWAVDVSGGQGGGSGDSTAGSPGSLPARKS